MSARRRSLSLAQLAIREAIAGGKHQVRIDTETGTATILPIDATAPHGDGAALDAEIREFIGDGDVAH